MSGFITSVRVDHKPGAPHSYVTVYIRGANCGTLCVREEEAEPLRALLTGDREKLDLIAAAAAKVMGLDKLANHPELLEQVAEHVQSEERRVHTLRSTAPVVVVKHNDWRPDPMPAVEATEYAAVRIPPGPSTIRKHQGFIDDPVRTPVFHPEVQPESRITPEQRASLRTTEGREFHVDPSLDLDAMNRGRAAVGMPPLERKGER
jgi:hypothetical protein